MRGPGRPGWLPTPAPHRSGLAHHAHPVPHLMNSRPARSVVVTWTWFRSRCTCQVSLQRLMRRHPLPLTGSLGLVPPLQRYYEVLRLPAAHFAALRFLRLAIPSLRPWFVPPAPDAEPWINLELVGGISSRLARWKRQGLPSSRRYPCDHSPYSSDPGVTRQAEWTMSKLPGAAPATDNDEGSPRVLISGLNRTAFDLAVYASQGWSPTHHARLASGCWSGSTGRDWLPAGFHLKGFKLPTILLSRAFLARGQTEFQVNLKLGLTPPAPIADRIAMSTPGQFGESCRPFRSRCRFPILMCFWI